MQQQTSLAAWKEVQPILSERQREVYNMLKDLGAANNMILAKKLGWDINRITPRVLELRKLGLIVRDSMRPCPITKRITWFWRCISSGK